MNPTTQAFDSVDAPEARPDCGIGGCRRSSAFDVFILLYPAAAVAAAPTYLDRGARVTVGHACKKHRGTWTVASFLNSPVWECSSNRQRFRSDFGGDPDPSLCRIDVVRG